MNPRSPYWLVALALVALPGVAAEPARWVLEQAVEATAATVLLPASEPGMIVVTGCEGCAPQSFMTTGNTRYLANRQAVTLHDLRHFYASGLIAAGCDVVTVQRALGHASATTTLNTYAHLWPSAEDRTRAAASDLMATVLGPSADSVRTSEAQFRSD